MATAVGRGSYSITHIIDAPKPTDTSQNSLTVGCDTEPTKITNDGLFTIEDFAAGGGYTWQNGVLTKTSTTPLGSRQAADGTFLTAAGPVDQQTGEPSLAKQVNPNGSVLDLTPLYNVFGSGPREVATAISDYDEAIGFSRVDYCCGGTVGAEVDHAIRWNSDGSVTDLNDVTGYIGGNPGVTLKTARGVNTAGDIVGSAYTDVSNGYAAPMWLEALPPIVLVPGAVGSRLIDASGGEHWLKLLGFHDDLALSGPGAFPGALYGDRVLQYEGPCGPTFCLSDALKGYGPFVDALRSTGMIEYATHTDPSESPTTFEPGRLTKDGCDTAQRAVNPDLFLFPYDWRQSYASTADALKDFMGCVRRFYTGPVVLVAHSGGGLVSRRYILNNPGFSNGVSQLITVGTPWLGAPKMINAMLTGQFIAPLVTNPTMKKILPTMYGPRALVPSEDYYFLADPPLYEAGYDLNRNKNYFDVYGPSDVNALFDAPWAQSPSPAVTADSVAFHATPGQDDWTNDDSKVHYTVIYSDQAVNSTIGRIVAAARPSCTGSGDAANSIYHCPTKNIIETITTAGDGTVPVTSAARVGNGQDLNNHDHETLVRLDVLSGYSDSFLEHTGLMLNPTVINDIEQIASRPQASGASITGASPLLATRASPLHATGASPLQISGASPLQITGAVGTTVGARTSGATTDSSSRHALASQHAIAASSSTSLRGAAASTTSSSPAAPAVDLPAAAAGWYVDVSGFTGDTAVIAPDGTSDAPSSDFASGDMSVRPTLPGVTHITEGDGKELVVTPFTGADTYKVQFTAGSDPLELDVRRGQQEAPDAVARWNDLSVPSGSQVTVTLAASGSPSLSYTDPTTGKTTAVAPTASVTGSVAQFDLTPPTISVGSIVLGGTRQYTLTATPGSAPVTRILWSVDGSSFQPYTGPIALDPSVSQLTAFADDAAGNRSAPQTFDLASAPISPVTTAVTSPTVPSSGYVAGPVTVLLHTRASDGTTVSLTYSISNPPKATTTTTVNGDTASFTLSSDGAYIVRYHATDSAGQVEPNRVLSVGVDQTAPSVSVTAPVQGATVGTLSSVTGTAADSGSKVARVDVALERNSDHAYWNGTTWSADPVYQTAAGTSSWSLPGVLPQGSALFAGGYSVVARATDGAGNTTSATSVFTVSAAAQIHPLNLPAGFSGSSLGTFGYAINGSGQVAGEVRCPGCDRTPVRWDSSGSGTALYPGSYCSFCAPVARGIDDTGTVVGHLPGSAVKWLPNGTAVLLTSSTGSLSANDWPEATNNLGVVAGESLSTWGTWTGSSFTRLPVPPGDASTGWIVGGEGYPMGINSSGTVVGTRIATTSSGQTLAAATVSNPATGASFLFPPDTGWNSYAAGINDAGDIVGTGGTADAAGSPDGSLGIPFLRHADGTVTRFPTAPRDSTGSAIAMDINNNNVIVGFAGTPRNGGSGAWVIYNGVVKKLGDLLPPGSGWTLNDAWAINDANQIVGNGVFNGASRG